MDILRGFAFTKPDGLIVDMFHFTDEERFLELNEGGEAQLLKLLEDVVLGRMDVAARLQGPRAGGLQAPAARVRARSSTATTNRRAATPSSRSLRRTRSASCTA